MRGVSGREEEVCRNRRERGMGLVRKDIVGGGGAFKQVRVVEE